MQRSSLIVRVLQLIGLTGGLFLGACTSPAEKAILNTAEMIEADDTIINSVMGLSVLSVYLCKALPGVKDDVVLCADVYVCKSFKRDSILGDTVIILDTQLRAEMLGNPDIYWTELQKAKNRKVCKVVVPSDQLSRIRKYPYKYARVTLITDD